MDIGSKVQHRSKKIEISHWLSETSDNVNQYVVREVDETGYVIRSTLTPTLEQAQSVKKDWDKQLIVI